MPVLTIVAGPNGAGKSTVGNRLLINSSIQVFDLDKEFYSLWSGYDFDPMIETSAYNQAIELYVARREHALLTNKDFAFETNFHVEEVLTTIETFKRKGYYLDLVFIFLDSPEVAVSRVKDRVAKGGHSVEAPTIRNRFFQGLSLLDVSFHEFGMIQLFHSRHNEMEGLGVLRPLEGKVMYIKPMSGLVGSHLLKIREFMLAN